MDQAIAWLCGPVRLLLNDAQIDRFVAGGRRKVSAACCLLSLFFVLPKGWSFGLTGCMLLIQGSCSWRLRQWRTDPGLWMLGLLLTISLGGCWVCFEADSLMGLFARAGDNPQGPNWGWVEVGRTLDAAIAFVLYSTLIRFVASTTVANWRQTSPRPRRARQYGPNPLWDRQLDP